MTARKPSALRADTKKVWPKRRPPVARLRLAGQAVPAADPYQEEGGAMRVTLGSLRADRAQYQREHAIAAGLLPDLGDTVLVLSRWSFTGRGQPPATTPPMGGAA